MFQTTNQWMYPSVSEKLNEFHRKKTAPHLSDFLPKAGLRHLSIAGLANGELISQGVAG